MPVIERPEDALPAFGGPRRAQIVLGRGLVEQMRTWHLRKREAAPPKVDEKD